MNNFTKNCIATVLMFVAKTLVMLIAGVLTGCLLIPIAYEQRGVLDFGGEWILIFAVAMIAAYVFDHCVSEPFMEGLQNEKK